MEEHLWQNRGRTGASKKLRALCYDGIPPGIRGTAWPELAGNQLQVTAELFAIFLAHAKNLRAGLRAAPAAPQPRDTGTLPVVTAARPAETDPAASPAAAVPRGSSLQQAEAMVEGAGAVAAVGDDTEGAAVAGTDGARAGPAVGPWRPFPGEAQRGAGHHARTAQPPRVCADSPAAASSTVASGESATSERAVEAAASRAAGVATAAVATHDLAAEAAGLHGTLGREGSMRLIDADLPRTFPDLSFFQTPPLSDALRDVLEAFVCYRPDVGYVQGMSFLAAMLLLFCDTAGAFVGFANLVAGQGQMAVFRLDPQAVSARATAFSAALRETLPDLAAHFDDVGLQCDLFLIDWFLTIFAKSAPLEVAARLWDVFLLEGQPFMTRAGLGILRMYRRELLGMDMPQALRFLKRLPNNMDPWDLMVHVKAVKLPKRRG